MSRRPPPLLAPVLLGLLLTGGVARATEGLAYRWQTPRVTVTWEEPDDSPGLRGTRRQVAHWKRLAQTLWAQKPGAPPLRMTVTLAAPDQGGAGPRVRLEAGPRQQEVTGTISEAAVRAALRAVRGDTPAGPSPEVPADDTAVSVSPDGRWIAFVSWRGAAAGPEVWVSRPDSSGAFRVSVPGAAGIEAAIPSRPLWSTEGEFLAWIQGGRVVLCDMRLRTARLVSPTDAEAVQAEWSPHTIPTLLVRYADETLQVLDVLRSRAVPVSDLLKEAAPVGRVFWSPSGRRLLFRTQTRILTTDLSARGGATAIQRFMDRLLGRPEPPRPRFAAPEERLAVLDFGFRRLDAYALKGTPLERDELHSVNWSPLEDTLFAVGVPPGGEGAFRLVRLPLAESGAAAEILSSDEPLAAAGRRGSDVGPVKYAFLHGDQLLVLDDSPAPEPGHPLSPSQLVVLQLPAGPEGGYAGVEEEEITESEAGLRVALEQGEKADRTSGRFRFPDGFLAILPLEGGLVPALQGLVRQEAPVELDLHPGKFQRVAAAVLSAEGGVGQLVVLQAERNAPEKVHRTPLSYELGRAPVIPVTAEDRPFTLTDAHSGVAFLGARYVRPGGALFFVTGAVLGLVMVGGLLFFVHRRGARR